MAFFLERRRENLFRRKIAEGRKREKGQD